MPCQIVIEELQAGPPFHPGGALGSVLVFGRVSAGCLHVRVQLSAASGVGPIADVVVEVDFTNAATAPGQLAGLVRLSVPLPETAGLQCGDPLWVEITCTEDAGCRAGRRVHVHCKEHPDGDGGTGGGGTGGGWWPPTRCLFAASGAAIVLLAGLTGIALGVGTLNGAIAAAGVALVLAAALPWALWRTWCGPSVCTRLGVLCWVFKRSFVLAIPVIAVSGSALIVLVIVAYGTAAGLLVQALEKRGCTVPSARGPLTQLPI